MTSSFVDHFIGHLFTGILSVSTITQGPLQHLTAIEITAVEKYMTSATTGFKRFATQNLCAVCFEGNKLLSFANGFALSTPL